MDKKLEIIISERIYNGKISEGKVTSRKHIYTASNGNGMLENVEEVYPDKINSSKKELNLTDKDGIYLTSILPIFETTYKYDEEANNNRCIPEECSRYKSIKVIAVKNLTTIEI